MGALDLGYADEQEVARLCADVCRISGVQLGSNQRQMVLSRLLRRALSLGLAGLGPYLEHYRHNRAAETEALVSLLTTHHTFFFREAAHFEYLEREGLAHVVAAARARGAKRLRILSAACSRGPECYTLSMLLADFLTRRAPDLTYEILGTDIDPESIAIADNGVYHRDEIKPVPAHLLGDHWTRGTGAISDFVKARASIKAPCTFRVDNLLAPRPAAPDAGLFDLVFCRNVFIYFTPEQVKTAVAALTRRMQATALLFVGLSESLTDVAPELTAIRPAVYARGAAKTAPLPAPAPRALVRVLCVDDSPVILQLMRKILTAARGFEVVATAANGLEATAALAAHEVDVMTLDIHMPKQDGLSYLRQRFSPAHPPVIVISSASRDDAGLATACLQAGAADYVEKPSLGDLDARADEIGAKLRGALLDPSRGLSPIDAAFSAPLRVADPGGSLRLILMRPDDRERVSTVLAKLAGPQPATIVLVEGQDAPPFDFAATTLRDASIYTGAASQLEDVVARFAARKTSVLIFGAAEPERIASLTKLSRRHVVVEEGAPPPACPHRAVPATSFLDLSNQFLAGREV